MGSRQCETTPDDPPIEESKVIDDEEWMVRGEVGRRR